LRSEEALSKSHREILREKCFEEFLRMTDRTRSFWGNAWSF
jgi:hypothetical protein